MNKSTTLFRVLTQGNRKFSNRHTSTPFLSLLIKIIQSFLETIRIILRFLGSISPLFFKVGTSGWQWFALNQCRNIIGNIVGLVFPRVSTKGFASATIDEKLFKVGLCAVVFDDCLVSLVYRVRHSKIVVYLMGASSMEHVISEQAQENMCSIHHALVFISHLYLPQSSRGTTTSLNPSPKWHRTRS